MDRDGGGSNAFVCFSADASTYGQGVRKSDDLLPDKIYGRAQEQYMNRVVQHLRGTYDNTQQPSRGAW